MEHDRHIWENATYMTLPGTHAPLCTSDFISVDQGSAVELLWLFEFQ